MDGIGLRAEAAGSGARVLEIAAEGGDQEGAEDDVGTAEPLLVSPCSKRGHQREQLTGRRAETARGGTQT